MSQAFQNFLKASELAKQTGIKHLILEANRSLGISYIVEKNYTKAVDYLSKSLKAAEEIDDKNEVAYILSELGEVSYLNKDYTKALEYYNQALNLAETATCKCEIPQDLNNIAKVYAALKENEKFKQNFFLNTLDEELNRICLTNATELGKKMIVELDKKLNSKFGPACTPTRNVFCKYSINIDVTDICNSILEECFRNTSI